MLKNKVELQKQFWKLKNKERAKFLLLYKNLFMNNPVANWTTDIKFNGASTFSSTAQFGSGDATICELTPITITAPYTIAFKITAENVSLYTLNGIFIRDNNNMPASGTVITSPFQSTFPPGYGNAIGLFRGNNYLNSYLLNRYNDGTGNAPLIGLISMTLDHIFIIREDWNNNVWYAVIKPGDSSNSINLTKFENNSINSTTQRTNRSIGIFSTRPLTGTSFNPAVTYQFVTSPI